MNRVRSDSDLGALLDGWMSEVAPTSIPAAVLEAAFAQTMSSRQMRVYPWDRVIGHGSRSRGLAGFAIVATAAILVVVIAFGALGGRRALIPTPSPTPSATPRPSGTPTPSPTLRALVPVPVKPTASVAVGQPMALATDGKSVWVLTVTGLVQRIDPATNTLEAGIPTGPTAAAYQGISADANGVWVTEWDTTSVYRVDPVARKVTADIIAGLAPKGVLATKAAVWVADTHDGKVIRIDPDTNKIVATVTVGPRGNSGPNWLASGFGSIWVDVPNNETVVRIDPITNAIQATIAIPSTATPCGVFAITATSVWNTSCDNLQPVTRIDPATDAVVATVGLDGRGHDAVVINGVPWVSIDQGASGPGLLGRISSATNTVDLQLVPGPEFGGDGDMVVVAGSVWVIDTGHDRILRLPSTAFTAG